MVPADNESGAQAEDLPVPEVGEQSGLDHDEILLLEGLLHGDSLHNSDVDGDVEAQGGQSLLSEDSEPILEVKTPHSVRFACSVASGVTGKTNMSAKFDTMTGEDESRIGANVVAKMIAEGRQDTVLSVVLGTGVGIGQPQDNLRTCPNYYERILTGQA